MSYRPLFIFGLARSGTNLLARMLDRHPAVTVALDPFLPIFRALRNAVVNMQAPVELSRQFNPASSFQDYYFDLNGSALLDLMLNTHIDLPLDGNELNILRGKTAERAALESDELGLRMSGLEGKNYGGLLKNGLDIIADMKPDASWVGCKEVWVIEFAPLLARLFPNAHFLVVERDPRAIVASLLAMTERDPTQAAHPPSYLRHWRKQVALTHRFERDPMLAGRFRSISFERLATGPEEEARKLCDELDIDFNLEMLNISANGWQGNSSYDHGRRGIYTDTVDCWREVLPEKVVQAADFLCAPEMALTSYRPVSTPNPNVLLAYLKEAGLNSGSWRSDSGDLLGDFGGELVRHVLLEKPEMQDEKLVRQCFLFRETLDAIRHANV